MPIIYNYMLVPIKQEMFGGGGRVLNIIKIFMEISHCYHHNQSSTIPYTTVKHDGNKSYYGRFKMYQLS